MTTTTKGLGAWLTEMGAGSLDQATQDYLREFTAKTPEQQVRRERCSATSAPDFECSPEHSHRGPCCWNRRKA